MIYCIVPRELAGKLFESLRRFYGPDPSIEVVVERRSGERRRRATRRSEQDGIPTVERRATRNDDGRRVGERRSVSLPVKPPPLPRKAARYAEQLLFIERVDPVGQYAEDLDSDRLVARAQGGDTTAFGDLYLRYFGRVYGYLRVALRDSHEAEDMTQQVFTQAFEALPRYEIRRKQPFRPWLFRIARNEAIKHLDKHRRIRVVDPGQIERELDTGADEAIDSALRWVSDGDLLFLIERLPQPQRQALALSYMLDLKTDEIATVLDRTPESVRQLQHRALRFLEARLTALGRKPVRSRREATLVPLRQAPVLRSRRFVLVA